MLVAVPVKAVREDSVATMGKAKAGAGMADSICSKNLLRCFGEWKDVKANLGARESKWSRRRSGNGGDNPK